MAAPSGGGKEVISVHEGRKCCGVFLCRKAEAESLCSTFAKNVQRVPEGQAEKSCGRGLIFISLI